jgi:hypothetical protein
MLGSFLRPGGAVLRNADGEDMNHADILKMFRSRKPALELNNNVVRDRHCPPWITG